MAFQQTGPARTADAGPGPRTADHRSIASPLAAPGAAAGFLLPL